MNKSDIAVLCVACFGIVAAANASPWGREKEVTPPILEARFHNLEMRVKKLEEILYEGKPAPAGMTLHPQEPEDRDSEYQRQP